MADEDFDLSRVFTHPDLTRRSRNAWVGPLWSALLIGGLVWILVGMLQGCSASGTPATRIELAGESSTLRPGESAMLRLRDGEGRPVLLPENASWVINGVPGGSPFYGQITDRATYIAPDVPAPRRFEIRLVRPGKKSGEQEVLAVGWIDVAPGEEPTSNSG